MNSRRWPAMPVTKWDNKTYHGLPLSDDVMHRAFMDDVAELRARQQVYEETLPSTSHEALGAALRVMHPDGEEYPEGLEKALHLSCALRALINGRDLDAEGLERDAALWIAGELIDGLSTAATRLDHVSNILDKARKGAKT